ncbi:MAG TPA: TetR/AcrR family transcriptional regulator [Thermoanaerobaculia bacterium]|nr:TetR/AcrR family transcriptional regulator [Thermoanaerobaculia bacterium]
MVTDDTQTSRGRLLTAGKELFSRLGYEQTSTATIAREAGTSESQLVRYFGGKQGLLDAIFNESWRGLNELISQTIAGSEHGREAILGVFSLMIEAFSQDPEGASIFMFEGRRVRGNEVALSKGFQQFVDLVCRLIQRGQSDGSFRSDVNEAVLASAMMGAAEGMMRDRLIARRGGKEEPFDSTSLRRIFEAMVNGLA